MDNYSINVRKYHAHIFILFRSIQTWLTWLKLVVNIMLDVVNGYNLYQDNPLTIH